MCTSRDLHYSYYDCNRRHTLPFRSELYSDYDLGEAMDDPDPAWHFVLAIFILLGLLTIITLLLIYTDWTVAESVRHKHEYTP